MPMDLQELQKKIEMALPGSQVQVVDLVGDGDHLQATVISELFVGKSLLQQHQLVNGALQDVFKDQLHALALKTFTPDQWNKK
ncbi:MAG: BolA family transcriptional regulator [Deltaproteobacteria bacterium]|nr:BolA family transcriptional regulator [Deltaproteobacteria bacterium]